MKKVALAGAVVLVLSSCSGESAQEQSAPSAGVRVEDGVQIVTMHDTDQYRFVPADPHVKVGKVRIDLLNRSKTTTHSLVFKPGGPEEEIPYLNPDDTKSISFTVSTPGDYQFFCTFHEQLGQSGTLTVE